MSTATTDEHSAPVLTATRRLMDYEELLQIMRHGTPEQVRDAQARAAADHGEPQAAVMVNKASLVIQREQQAQDAITRLAAALAEAVRQVSLAELDLADLGEDGRARHPAYAGTLAGTDLGQLLADVSFKLRTAIAFNLTIQVEQP